MNEDEMLLDRLFKLKNKNYRTGAEEVELEMLEKGYKEYIINRFLDIMERKDMIKMNLAEQMYQKACGIPQIILDKINEETGLGKTSFYLNNLMDIKLYDCIRDNQSKLVQEGFKVEKGMMGIAISWDKSKKGEN